MTADLSLLIEQHKRDIWEWKQKESQWVKDKNQLDGGKQIIEELSTKLIETGKLNLALKNKITELEGTLGSAQDINTTHQKYNGKLQLRLTEVEEDNKKLATQIQDLNNQKS